MQIAETLAPILILIALGVGLARIRFLGATFIADLNKLAFWIALPAYIFRNIATAAAPAPETGTLVAILAGSTVLVALAGYGVGAALRAPAGSRGTLVQAGFRGNLAYIGIPAIAYSYSGRPAAEFDQMMATTLLVIAPITALFNVLAVVVLQADQHRFSSRTPAILLRSIALNPLIIACLGGLAVALTGLRMPVFLDRSLDALGAAALPIALLCIGGSLATASFRGRRAPVIAAALLKVIVFPCVAWSLARAFGVGGASLRTALVLAACPTAAASYIMARQMGGDEALASGAIAASTLLAVFSLAAALALTD